MMNSEFIFLIIFNKVGNHLSNKPLDKTQPNQQKSANFQLLTNISQLMYFCQFDWKNIFATFLANNNIDFQKVLYEKVESVIFFFIVGELTYLLP